MHYWLLQCYILFLCMFFTWKICSSQYLSARKGDCFLGVTLLKWGIPSRGRRGDPSVHHSRNTTGVGWFGYESLFSLRESICCLVCRSLLWVFCFVGAGLTLGPTILSSQNTPGTHKLLRERLSRRWSSSPQENDPSAQPCSLETQPCLSIRKRGVMGCPWGCWRD